MPPRLIWQRLAAVVVDWLVVWVLTTLLLLPFLRPDETGLRLGAQPLTWSSCEWRAAPEGALGTPRGAGVAAGSRICTQYALGLYNGRVSVVNFGGRELRKPSYRGAASITVSTAQSARFPINAEGETIATFVPQRVLVPLGLLLLSAIALARGWQTPGKRLLRLRVQGRGCAACREMRRLGVFVVWGTVQMLLSLSPDAVVAVMRVPSWITSVLGLVAIVAVLVYYIWPVIVWRGSMFYDRATGFEVVCVMRR